MNSGPLIFDIKRGSLDDGPGIRSVVFLKGCPLRCEWCHNPESQSPVKEQNYVKELCIHCGFCLTHEGRCVTGARLQVGEFYGKERLIGILEEDLSYYRASGGGVTFSGGEPLMNPEYVGSLSGALQKRGISVFLETCGQFAWKDFERWVLPYVDGIYYDLKIMDSDRHRRYTGCGNEVVLDNFVQLARGSRSVRGPGLKIIPRTPAVPGITDTPQNKEAIRTFLEGFGMEKEHVWLPFHEPK